MHGDDTSEPGAPADDGTVLVDPNQYDGIAAVFAEHVDGAPVNELYERPVTMELLGDVAGRRVLDAGVGNGWYAEALLDRGASVVGVDASEGMLATARRRLERRATFWRADLNEPLDMLDDQSFDTVLAALVLHHVERWEVAFTEFARVLRPGGELVLSIPHPLADLHLSGSGHYLDFEVVHDSWQKRGRRVEVSFYRRPLGALFTALSAADLWLDAFVEPGPTDATRERFPELHARLEAMPLFLMVRAVKPADI